MSVQVSVGGFIRPGGRTRWLAAALVALLLVSGLDNAAASTRLLEAPVSDGAELSSGRDDRVEIARQETELRNRGGIASSLVPDGLSSAPAVAPAFWQLEPPRSVLGQSPLVWSDIPLERLRGPSQPRAPPSPASFG